MNTDIGIPQHMLCAAMRTNGLHFSKAITSTDRRHKPAASACRNGNSNRRSMDDGARATATSAVGCVTMTI